MLGQKNRIILYAFLTIVLLGGSGFYAVKTFWKGGGAGRGPVLTVGEWWQGGARDISEDNATDNTNLNGDNSTVFPADLSQTFFHEDYGFSFKYPEGFSAAIMTEESGELVLVQGPMGKSFQIFVSPFDEPADELTASRIQADLPDMEIKNLQQIMIGNGDIPALIFNSVEQGLGDTREIWFVWPPDPLPHGNYLFQVTAYADLDAFLGPILETWKFAE